MKRPIVLVSVAACLLAVGVWLWAKDDPSGALRLLLRGALRLQGVQRRVWSVPGAGGEFYEAGADHERAVVLLHGAGGDALSSWFVLLPALARDYHVLAPQMAYASMDGVRDDHDHPLRLDHGGADRIGQELNGIHAAMRAAGVKRATVVGLSVGSWLALRLASQFPELVDGVVAVAPAGPNLRGVAERIAASGLSPGEWFFDNLFYDGPPVPKVFFEEQYPIVESWVGNLRWYVDLIDGGGDGAELVLRRVGCPVELVWGRDDRILPLEGRAFYEANLGDVDVRVLDECGHAVVWDRPDALERIVRRFMNGRGK